LCNECKLGLSDYLDYATKFNYSLSIVMVMAAIAIMMETTC